jgi:hypothetical protein
VREIRWLHGSDTGRTHLELLEVLVDLANIGRDHERIVLVPRIEVLPSLILGGLDR